MIEMAEAAARRAVDAAAEAPLMAIVGPAASGKTETLARRYASLLARDPSLAIAQTIVTASRPESAQTLAGRIRQHLTPERAAELTRDDRTVGAPLERLAFDILSEHTTSSRLAYDLEAIDAFDAEEIFERAIAPLFSADWSDYLGPEIDPEIPGLRAPDRFAVAVFRLIRKLRDAHIGPDDFLAAALRGATAFYANPPNLTAPALLYATKDEHRPALAVDAAERERQRRRELDLAKIVAKLYRSYLDEQVARGCLTGSDAIAEATRLLRDDPAVARAYRARFRIALVDDVHDLHTGPFRLLQAIFGPSLPGVTVAGDADAATETFAGARPERIFAGAASTVTLQANHRVPAQIAGIARALLDGEKAQPVAAGDAVRLHRAADVAAEATFVAESVAQLIANGTPPGRIAVVHRSLRTLAAYEDALVDRDVPIALIGDAALFDRHDALDALALLWCTVDPFRHAWLLRVLQSPPLRYSDATLALLCGEPPSAQGLLFDLPAEQESDGSRRWDRRRDLRLATNVVRGDRDADLGPAARERLVAFRARRARWQELVRAAGAAHAARAIAIDGGMFAVRPGETAARARRRGAVTEGLLAAIERYGARHPMDDLAGALAYCERIARSESGPAFADRASDAVVLASIDRIKSRRFEHVFVVDVRAGSFPPYYVPDAFLFSPTYGMIPKDSVGDAVTARTAKFTWYHHHAKLREAYGREDRRLLAAAMTRADATVTLSASGRATRGVGAPEFLAELQALRPALALAETPPRTAALPPPAPHAAVVEPEPVETPRRVAISAGRAAAMVTCVRCAARRSLAAAPVAPAALLRAPGTAGEAAAAARDVRFAAGFEATVVHGTVPALLRHAGKVYVAVSGDDAPAQAAIALRAFGDRVSPGSYFTQNDDGTFAGPLALDPLLGERVAAVLDGRNSPLCRFCT